MIKRTLTMLLALVVGMTMMNFNLVFAADNALAVPGNALTYDTTNNSVQLVESNFVSNSLKNDVVSGNDNLVYKIYLPKGYDQNRVTPYPVLYLLHGSGGKVTDWDAFWPALDSMIQNGTIEPVIAVAPVSGNSYWVDSDKFGAYESAVINDLIPHIDSQYNTKKDRTGRYLIGFSMGGYGVLRYAMTYPDLFNAATLLSPAIENQEPAKTSGAVERGSFGTPFDLNNWTSKNYPTAIKNIYSKSQYKVPVYVFAGDDDWNHLSEKEDLPTDANKYNMEVQCVQLYEALHRENLYNKDFNKWDDVPASPVELRIINGGHSTNVWLKGFQEGIKYMFGKQESSEYSPKYNKSDYNTTKKGSVSTNTLSKAPQLVKDSKTGNDDLSYVTYLPYGYDPQSQTKYPVLYLLHGSGGKNTSWDDFWPILDNMIANGEMKPVIAIAPVTGNSYWVDSDMFGAYESAIMKDLIPYVDANYNTIPNRTGRGLIGYSMGGYGAIRYGLVYPDIFGAVTLLSPAIENQEPPATSRAATGGSFGSPFSLDNWNAKNYPAAIKSYAAQSNIVPVFIYAGDDDWNHLSEKEDLLGDANKYNMEVQAVNLYESLHRVNIFNKDFNKWDDVPASPAELRIVNGGHNMDVWGAGFKLGINYMFSNGLTGPQTPATVAGVTSTNGKLTIKLSAKPTSAPSADDFKATININNTGEQALTLKNFNYDGDITVTYDFNPVLQSSTTQNVVVSIKISAQAFSVGPAAPSPSNDTPSSSSPSTPAKAETKTISHKRIEGNTRINTAAAIAEEYSNGTVQNVVIAVSDNYPDALSGSVLANKLNAPILLSGNDSDNTPTLDYIKKHLDKNGTVYILGGTGAVPDTFIDILNSIGYKSVKRLSGHDRYETNEIINNEINVAAGTPVIVATGENFPDALSVSSIAASKGYPIVLLQNDKLPQSSINFLGKLKPSKVYVIGGNNTISENTVASIKELSAAKNEDIVRISGQERYETSLNIAKYFNMNSDKVFLATGDNYPDALAGSVLAAKYNAPIILVGDNINEQKKYLDTTKYSNRIIFGGSGAVNKSIEDLLSK